MKNRPEGTGLYPHTDDKSTQARHHSYLCVNMKPSKSSAGWREIFSDFVQFIQCFMRALRSLYVNWETMLTSAWPLKSTHSGRGVDVACVVSNLERAEHRCHNGGQQRDGQLILGARTCCSKSIQQGNHIWGIFSVQAIHLYKLYSYVVYSQQYANILFTVYDEGWKDGITELCTNLL